MNKKLMIIGAGGHGRVIADVARSQGYDDISFLDDGDTTQVSVSGKVSDWEYFADTHDFIIGIGNNVTRERIACSLSLEKIRWATLVHPTAVIGSKVNIGVGCVVMPYAVVNTGTVIGAHSIINTYSSVDHDCELGEYVHVSVGAHLAGSVTVGKRTMIAAGATVINNVSICPDCIIGAGATVVKSISEKGTWIGLPAKKK